MDDGFTTTPDPIYPDTGEDLRIDGRIVGRIRRMSSGRYGGTATWSNLSVVPDLYAPDPSDPTRVRKPTRADAISLVLEQARRDLRDERNGG